MTLAAAGVVVNPSIPGTAAAALEQSQLVDEAASKPAYTSQVTPNKDALYDLPLWSPSATELNVDPRFVMRKCELPPQNEFEPVASFVSTAVREQHEQKTDDTVPLKNYKGILEALRFKSDIPLLIKILLALRTASGCIELLTGVSSKHARLIHQLVRFNPFQLPKNDEVENSQSLADYALADAHLSLVVTLVSANSVFLVPATTALWKLLISDAHTTSQERRLRLHAALATIMRLCPKAKMELFPIIAANAPFRTRPESELSWYYSQCLYVLEYVPGMEGQVIELLIDKSLEMDVEIKVVDNGEAVIDSGDGDCDGNFEEVFQLELDGIEEKEAKPKLPAGVTVDEISDKLDSLMLIIFEHVEKRISRNPSDIHGLYQEILRSFESSILITHKSKFVQFLVFSLCGLESRFTATTDPPLLYREFAGKLIEVILDPYRATVTRQSGACYLASFISRAAYVCPETICESVSALLRWAEAYVESLGGSTVHAADVRNQCSLHSLFYTVCQSAFYIMCFRGVEAVKFYTTAVSPSGDSYDEPERIDIGKARWTSLCSHPLQPLRWCLESVRSEFLVVSKAFNLLDEEVLKHLVTDNLHLATARVQRKRRVSRIMTPVMLEQERQTGGVGGLGRGTNPLDSFFPFDPYLLRRSNRCIEPFYKHWHGSLSEEIDNVSDYGDELDQEGTECSPTDLDENESDDDDDDDEEEDDDNPRRQHMKAGASVLVPTSFASNASSASSKSSVLADVEAKSQSIHEKWTKTLKRTRAPSVENGSW